MAGPEITPRRRALLVALHRGLPQIRIAPVSFEKIQRRTGRTCAWNETVTGKCEFGVKKVISPDGVGMEGDNIEDWPTPESVKGVRVSLGFTNFYRRFIGMQVTAHLEPSVLQTDASGFAIAGIRSQYGLVLKVPMFFGGD